MAKPAKGDKGHKKRLLRRMTAEESARWRHRLEQRWGLRDLCWHPQLTTRIPADVLILHERSMWIEPCVERVREALRQLGGHPVAELRESPGIDCLIKVDHVSPRYAFGDEGVWTDHTLDWIAHASHEGTVAFGGTVATLLPTLWPDIDDWRWHHR
ncbi:MAG TPA: hypothetical protein VGD67_02670 [Pseudonocardiaceae bacterium]